MRIVESTVAPATTTRTLDVLFVGNLARHSRATSLARAMSELGHRVGLVDAEVLDENGDRVYFDDPVFRVLRRLGLPPDRQGVNEAVRSAVAERRYDIVWISKALALRAEVLEHVRRLHPDVRLVFHSEDDMFARHNQSRHFRRALPLYDVVFTHKSYNAEPHELPSLGAREVVMVDKCFDRHLHRPLEVDGSHRDELGGEVGFIGTYEAERAAALLSLAQAGVPVRVQGSHWDRLTDSHPRLRVERRELRGDDYVRAICATDVNLGFLRKQNRDLQTDRSLEIPACGAFMLAERTDEHQALFTEGVEAEYFSSAGELARKVRHYLDNPRERRRIAAAGRERCLQSGYSYHDRAARMLAIAEASR